MRLLLVRAMVLAVAALTPVLVLADDQKIASTIIERLAEEKNAGHLRDFGVDVEVDQGTVMVSGRVASGDQQQVVLEIARRVQGVNKVVDDLKVQPTTQPVVASQPAKPLASPVPAAAPPAPATPVYHDSAVAGPELSSQVVSQPQGSQPTVAMNRTPVRSPTPLGAVVNKPAATPVAAPMSPAAPLRQPQAPRVSQPIQTVQFNESPRGNSPEQLVENAVLVPEVKVDPRATAANSVRQVSHPTPTPQQPAAPGQFPADHENYVRQLTPQQIQYLMAVQQQQAAYYAYMSQMAAYQQQGPQHPGQPQYVSARPPQGGGNPIQLASAMQAGGPGGPAPFGPNGQVPAPGMHYMPTGAGGGQSPQYDHPQLPNYAWPSYAPHPNYGAVTVPKQYSPTAWPYIGPFYPYPQVPLGWRKVTLEWDDGWWMLDFKDR
ncbi:BON domain-containing protein [Lignipirellula cremea]|uniref:Periplasmic protein n=1 Tax=Lignipirellula cremea TaxID=2528010 RepID=A0A518DTU2_9BACT|nr:BON domain-containing protein [Lignipirellula cremea]QDU95249.1 periplasmic protein [Lignipirellula cremea]